MKKKLWLVVPVIIVLLVLFIVIFGNSNKEYLKELSYEELVEKIDNKESFILYIKQESCSHCKTFTPVLEKVVNANEVEVYYVVIDLWDEDNKTYTEDNVTLNKTGITIDGTPTIVFIKNGKEVTDSRLVGGQDSKVLIKKFKENGYIK